jgi:hypothetical protein
VQQVGCCQGQRLGHHAQAGLEVHGTQQPAGIAIMACIKVSRGKSHAWVAFWEQAVDVAGTESPTLLGSAAAWVPCDWFSIATAAREHLAVALT